MNNKKNINITNNHASQKNKNKSLTQISLRFQLLEDCLHDRIEITEKIKNAVKSDKAFVQFTYNTDYEDGNIETISVSTIRTHGKLIKMQYERGKVNAKLQAPVPSTVEISKPKVSKKETKTSLEKKITKLEESNTQISAELITLRSAYKELLVVVDRILPLNEEVKNIIKLHNKSSLVRKNLKGKVDHNVFTISKSKNDN